jgi:hypothetical protein
VQSGDTQVFARYEGGIMQQYEWAACGSEQ